MWQLWRESNKAFSEEKLPAPALISETMPSHAWNLPNEEYGGQSYPARMPFYYGYKGARPTVGYPLFLYLHGSGDKGQEWTNGRRFAGHFQDGPSIYFVPQIPNEGQLYRWWQRSKLYAWDKLLRLALLSDRSSTYLFLRDLRGRVWLTASRFVLCRLSSGGRAYGRWRTPHQCPCGELPAHRLLTTYGGEG